MNDGLAPLRDVIRKFDLQARKSLGQNFLLDLNLTERIARSGGDLQDTHIIEVGPGPGGLTRSLLAAGAAHVTAIERDPRCIGALQEIAARWPGKLTIVEGDALSVDIASLASENTRIVANLPYNIATPLLVGWLQTDPWPPWFRRLTLMFQLEVAERITARPGTKAFGRLSILAGWRADAHILFKVPPEAFSPAPKVVSAIVDLVPRASPEPCDVTALETVTRVAFGQRRKMLRASLKGLWPDPEPVLTRAGVSPTARPETLSVSQFVALANCITD